MALGSAGINIGFVGALLAGGMVAAPLAAWLVKHLQARVLGVAAGGLILVTNSQTVLESVGAPGTVIAMTALVLAMVWVALIGWTVVQERRADTPDEELATSG
jgi:hypothetical protein